MALKLPHQIVPTPLDTSDASTKGYADGITGGGGTLDDAYDYGGAGAGRAIVADTGPVEITAASNTGLSLISGSNTIELGKPISTPLSLAGIFVDGVSTSRPRGLQWHLPTLAANAGVAVEANLHADEQALIAIEGATSTFTSRGMVELYNDVTGAVRPMMLLTKAPGAATSGNLLRVISGSNAVDPSMHVEFSSNVGLRFYNASGSNAHGDLRFDEGRTSDPSSPLEGEVWYRSDLEKLRLRLGSSTVDIPGAGGGGGTLQGAYDAGNTIDTSSNGTVALSNTANGFTNIMSITRQPTSAFQGGSCLALTHGPNTTSAAVLVDYRSNTNAGIFVDIGLSSGTAHGIHVDADTNDQTGIAVTDNGNTPSGLYAGLIHTATVVNGDTRPNIYVRRAFSSATGGDGIVIFQNSTNVQGRGIRFESPFSQAADIQFSSRNADPSVLGEGDLWYNSTSQTVKYYDGSSIVELGGGGGGGGDSLDSAYTTGQTIDVDLGPVALTNNNADNNGVLTITKSPAGSQSGSGLTVTMGAQTSSDALVVTQSGSGQAATFNGPVTINDKLTVTGLIDPTGVVLDAQASKPVAGAAGKLVIWAETGATTKIKFTDSGDTDRALVAVGDTSTPAATTVGLDETSGPTTLSIGSITDGEVLVRSGSTVTSQPVAAPGAHASTHEDGGVDEISVDALSGKLADNQTAGELATTGAAVVIEGAAPPSVGQVLKASDATTASWQDESGGGGAHDLGGASHNADTLANLNSKISDATLIDTGDSRLSDARTPTAHSLGGAEHSADTLANLNAKVSDATLDGQDDPRPADEIITTTGPTTLAVGAVADGQYLLRSGSTVIGGTPGGGGAADALSTTGADVSVSGAAPPSTGQVLKATGATTATWQDESGGSQALAAAGGDYLHATLGTAMTSALSLPQRVLIDTVKEQRGDLVLDITTNVGRVSGLKAGRTYSLLAGLRGDGSGGFWIIDWYNVTSATSLVEGMAIAVNSGSTSNSTSTIPYVLTPTEDTEVEFRITSADDLNDDITADRTWIQIVEIGAVQAEVTGGLEYLDTITVSAAATSVTFGEGGDGIIGRALDGDIDETYILDFSAKNANAPSSERYTIRPNNLATNQASQRFNSEGSSGSHSAKTEMTFFEGSKTDFSGSLVFHAKSGKIRTFHCDLAAADSSPGASRQMYSGTWAETSANITSLVVLSENASGIDAGSQFHLYRRTRRNLRADSADSYERHITAGVDQGSSTTTITLGHPNYGGSAVAINIQAEDATTAGTLVANLKVGGVTKLTATLDTTNTTNYRAVEQIGIHTFQPSDEITVEIVGDSSYTNAASATTGLTINITLTNEALFLQPANGVVAEMVLSAASDTISVSGLDGDAHGVYEVEWHLLIADDSNTHIVTVDPNGVNTNLYGTYHGSFSPPGVETAWKIGGKGSDTGRAMVGTARLGAARTSNGTTVKRTFTSDNMSMFDTSPYAVFQGYKGYWTDNANNLVSFDVVDDQANGFLTGSRVTVKKV